MPRKLVVLCLVAVTAAGPWLCCCSASQFAGPRTATATESAPPDADVCPHCRHAAPRPAGKSEPAPSCAAAVPLPGRCPATAAAGERAADAVGANALHPLSDLLPAAFAADALAAGTLPADTTAAESPHRPTRERLALLHILRC